MADSAVGVMEAFFAKHPDFGHTAHFAFVLSNCFATEHEFKNVDYCDQKLSYLAERGYEIGNHTWSHENLGLADVDTIVAQIGQIIDFIDARVTGNANMSHVLTLPFGERPDPNVNWAAWSAVTAAFYWNGGVVTLDAIMNVSGGGAYSPASDMWDPLSINRFNTDPDSLNEWFGAIEHGEVSMYTSDGNPATIVVPDRLSGSMAKHLDPEIIEDAGRFLVRYDPDTGTLAAHRVSPYAIASGTEGVNGARLRNDIWASGAGQKGSRTLSSRRTSRTAS